MGWTKTMLTPFTSIFHMKILMIRSYNVVFSLKECIIRRLTRPWLLWDFTYKFTWEAYEERKYLNVVHKFTENVIKEREKIFKATDFENIENNNGFKAKKRLAMLDLLMDCKRRDQIDDDGIKEEVDTFMFGVFIRF